MADAARLAMLLGTFDSSTPTLTVFRIAAGVRLVGPPVDGVAALLVLSGTMVIEVDGEAPHTVAAGSLALVSGRAHMAPAGSPVVATVEGRDCLTPRDGWLVAEAPRGREPALVVAAGRIAGSSTMGMSRTVIVPVAGDPVGRPIFAQVRAEYDRGAASLRAVAAVRARPAEPHTVDTLAAVAGMSRSTFIRHFKRALRVAPSEYVQQVRLEEARTMLESTELPIKIIAARTGFASRSHFSRMFRGTFGRDPSGYRERVRDEG